MHARRSYPYLLSCLSRAGVGRLSVICEVTLKGRTAKHDQDRYGALNSLRLYSSYCLFRSPTVKAGTLFFYPTDTCRSA